MNAVRITVEIPENREVRLKLPDEVPPGSAEIIVLSQTHPAAAPGRWSRIEEFLQAVPAAHPGRPREEIDRYLEEERASWGDGR